MAAAPTPVTLAPTPGFCVKSSALNDVLDAPLPIPAGLKIFVNIAWDSHIPPPPPGTDAAIERALSSHSDISPEQAAHWFLPLVLSDPRPDTDKSGKPSAVFDAIFNVALKPRALRSPELKSYLVELAFQRIEAQHGLLLSRQIGTPNIASKGKLKPRPALIPTSLFAPPDASSSPASGPSAARKPLIEELPPSSSSAASKPAAPHKGILKPSPAPPTNVPPTAQPAPSSHARTPGLTWSTSDGGQLCIALSVPHLTREAIPRTTLDVEARRLIFATPRLPGTPAADGYALDLDLTSPDSDIQKLFGSTTAPQDAVTLKHQLAFDVDAARAEWHPADGSFVVYV